MPSCLKGALCQLPLKTLGLKGAELSGLASAMCSMKSLMAAISPPHWLGDDLLNSMLVNLKNKSAENKAQEVEITIVTSKSVPEKVLPLGDIKQTGMNFLYLQTAN